MKLPVLAFLAFFPFLFSACETEQSAAENEDATGYNELAQQLDGNRIYTESSYNGDDPEIKNIKRPIESTIKTLLDTSMLFDVWVSDTSAPVADFDVSSKFWNIQDYDGDSQMPYILQDNSLKIYYNDFIQEGEIISLCKDTLTIKWNDFNKATYYVRWRF